MSNKSLNNKTENNDKSQTLVTVEVRVTFVNPDSGSAYEQNYTLPVFTVKGGNKRIASEIKKKRAHEFAQKIGSYPREIEDMVLKSVIVNDLPQDLQQLNDLTLYGSLLNYHGYGLMASMNAQTMSCVLDYVIAMLNNENEPNRNNALLN